MQSFIITFYRSGCENRNFIGTFADPASGGEQKFNSLEELHGLVEEAGSHWECRARKKNAPKKEKT